MNKNESINDTKIAILETTNNHLNKTLERMERLIEKNQSEVLSSINEIKHQIKSFDSRLWTNFYWILGAIAGIGALMAHGFKWF